MNSCTLLYNLILLDSLLQRVYIRTFFTEQPNVHNTLSWKCPYYNREILRLVKREWAEMYIWMVMQVLAHKHVLKQLETWGVITYRCILMQKHNNMNHRVSAVHCGTSWFKKYLLQSYIPLGLKYKSLIKIFNWALQQIQVLRCQNKKKNVMWIRAFWKLENLGHILFLYFALTINKP